MRPGQPYRPSKAFRQFARLPVGLLRDTWLTANDKIIFAALVRRAGRNETCWPSQTKLAEDCGMTRNQIRYSLARLGTYGLIAIEERRGETSVVRFLWHEALWEVGTPKPEAVPQAQAPRKKPPQRECGLCGGTGWKDAPRGGVVRCAHG